MHHREQIKPKHKAKQIENQREVSKIRQPNESLFTVPGEKLYIERLYTQEM